MSLETDEYEYFWFWETDEIYDYDGDLLIWSLMKVGMECFKEAIIITFALIPLPRKEH
jgi:hypothetical protein